MSHGKLYLSDRPKHSLFAKGINISKKLSLIPSYVQTNISQLINREVIDSVIYEDVHFTFN